VMGPLISTGIDLGYGGSRSVERRGKLWWRPLSRATSTHIYLTHDKTGRATNRGNLLVFGGQKKSTPKVRVAKLPVD